MAILSIFDTFTDYDGTVFFLYEPISRLTKVFICRFCSRLSPQDLLDLLIWTLHILPSFLHILTIFASHSA